MSMKDDYTTIKFRGGYEHYFKDKLIVNESPSENLECLTVEMALDEYGEPVYAVSIGGRAQLIFDCIESWDTFLDFLYNFDKRTELTARRHTQELPTLELEVPVATPKMEDELIGEDG